jgi:LCP family protein required for cell wall assembly
MMVFVAEIFVIIAMIGVLVYVMKQTENEEESGPIYASMDDVDPAQIGISEETLKASEEGGAMAGYTNIAFFGVDALSEKNSDLLKGYRSDSIMIASINNATGEVTLVSVYRDTYLNLGNDQYNKCNAAYAKGGATQAVTMLNANLDLNITNWVTVSYKALVTAVDDLGGVMIDVDSEELIHLNNYQIAVAQALGIPESNIVPVKETGLQRLNGMQAASYCRIRYTAGSDFVRTERQREVLKAMLEAAQGCDSSKLSDIFSDVMNYTYTSLDEKTFLDMILHISDYHVIKEGGFPNMDMLSTANLPQKGDCVVPLDLTENVAWLHEFLFDDTEYAPGRNVVTFSGQIGEDTAAYIR